MFYANVLWPPFVHSKQADLSVHSNHRWICHAPIMNGSQAPTLCWPAGRVPPPAGPPPRPACSAARPPCSAGALTPRCPPPCSASAPCCRPASAPPETTPATSHPSPPLPAPPRHHHHHHYQRETGASSLAGGRSGPGRLLSLRGRPCVGWRTYDPCSCWPPDRPAGGTSSTNKLHDMT